MHFFADVSRTGLFPKGIIGTTRGARKAFLISNLIGGLTANAFLPKKNWISSRLLFYEYWLHHGITEMSFVLLMICTIFLAKAEQASFLCSFGLTKNGG